MHRAQILQRDPDVLFKIPTDNRACHQLLFRPTNPELWPQMVNRFPPGVTFQLTMRSTGKEKQRVSTITLSGTEEELKTVTGQFPQLPSEVNGSVQDGGAAQPDPEDAVKEVEEGISKLGLGASCSNQEEFDAKVLKNCILVNFDLFQSNVLFFLRMTLQFMDESTSEKGSSRFL